MMKKILPIIGLNFFLLCLTFFSIPDVFADQSSLVTQYPTPKGTYKQFIFQDLQSGAPPCASNPGLIYVNPSGNNLEVCGTTSGLTTINVTYPQECFDRFNSGTSALDACPNGFAQVWATYTNNSSNTFLPCSSSSGCQSVWVTYCCSNSTHITNFAGAS